MSPSGFGERSEARSSRICLGNLVVQLGGATEELNRRWYVMKQTCLIGIDGRQILTIFAWRNLARS
jgi:hypothetical protein